MKFLQPTEPITPYVTNQYLVLQGNITKQVTHALVVVNATNGLCQENADVNRLDLVALHLLDLMWDSVCHHHLRIDSNERY